MGGAAAQITTDPSGGPYIRMTDTHSSGIDVGSADTMTLPTHSKFTIGRSQNTSADSIIMFENDKNHRVIWQAP
jgi:hypothetical protein